MPELKSPIDVAEYLYTRIHQLGIRSIFGVPGDYNLVALDYIPKCGLEWVGNCNELNAGYAADGYARIKGISALITTFGVGELSALNAVAGAYSEYVPLIHIVGTPSTISQSNGMLLHHTLGNGDFKVFSNMSRNVSCYTALLGDASTAGEMIDEAIRECYVRSRPVYIALPTDIVQKKVEGERLKTPIDLSSPPNGEEKENYAVERVLEHITKATNPIILVDACAIRHRALEEVHALIQKSNFPTFVTPMGKGAVDESLPNYGGVYAGSGSNEGVRERVEASDLVLSIGSIKSDFNTGGFSFRLSQMTTIDFHSDYVRVRYSEYPGVRMHGVLRKVVDRLPPSSPSSHPPGPQNTIPKSELSQAEAGVPTITHAWLWPRFGKWLKEKDVVLTETGTSNFGIWQTRFPADVTAISQVLWGSIGYATPACLGASLAAREMGGKNGGRGRTVLWTGDGSFQLVAQEVSTMIRHGLNPIIFIICNDGYAIERLIHGKDASYNDIHNWNYKDLVPAFGATPGSYKTYQVKTKKEADELFNNEEFASARFLQLVEVYMPRDDAPKELKAIAESTAENNAKM